MFVLNKKTGLKWDVEGELLERLLKSDDYEIVKEKKKVESKQESKKDAPKKTTTKKATTKKKSTTK